MLKQIPEIFGETLGKKTSALMGSAFVLLGTLTAFADTPAVPGGSAPSAASTAAAQAPGFSSMIFPFAAMFAVVYFLMIRPQQKKMKEQQAMLGQLKQGDEVVTTSGILGTITHLTDKVITLEVADKVRIRMLRSQVSQTVKGQEGGAV